MPISNLNTQYSRQRQRRFSGAGIVPTIPTNDDFTISPQLPTDVLQGEFIINMTDSKVWFRNEFDAIIEVTNNLFLGYFVSLIALQTAHPTGTSGQYAFVDAGIGIDAQTYIWDIDDAQWVLSGSAGSFLPLAGGTMSGAIDMSLQDLLNVQYIKDSAGLESLDATSRIGSDVNEYPIFNWSDRSNGFGIITNASNFTGYIKTDNLTAVRTGQVQDSDGTFAWLSDLIFSNITGTPTTIGGYGITDTTAQLLTGFVSGTGVVSASDSILQAINKLDGNINAITISSLGGVSGTGVSNQVSYWNGTSSQTGSSDFLWDQTNLLHTVNGRVTSNSSFTGLTTFTITGGATTINTTTITYSSNTTIKRGDGISGTNIPLNSFVTRIVSGTSAIINNRATATGTTITFTIAPSDFGNQITYVRTGISNSYGSALLIDFNDTNQAITQSSALTVINRATTTPAHRGITVVSTGMQLVMTSPETTSTIPTTWFMESSAGNGGTIGYYVLGTLTAGARSNIYQITNTGLISFTNTLTGSGINNASTSGFRLTGGSSGTVTFNSVNIGWENGAVTSTTSIGAILTVGTISGLTSPWTQTTGAGTLKVIRGNVTVNQTGIVATGGVTIFSAEPVITSIASTGFIRGFDSNIASGTGTRHNLYIRGTAQNAILAETSFGTLSSPASSCLIDMVSTTRGLGIPSMTSAQMVTMGVARNGNIVYQNDGTQGFYGVVNGVSVLIGGASVLRASKACTAEDGGTITAWSATTDFTYTITVTGATTAQSVNVQLDNAMASTISTNTVTLFAWISATDTVKVRVRVTSYINVTGLIEVAVF